MLNGLTLKLDPADGLVYSWEASKLKYVDASSAPHSNLRVYWATECVDMTRTDEQMRLKPDMDNYMLSDDDGETGKREEG